MRLVQTKNRQNGTSSVREVNINGRDVSIEMDTMGVTMPTEFYRNGGFLDKDVVLNVEKVGVIDSECAGI